MKLYTNFIGEQIEARVIQDPELKDKPVTLFYDYPVRDISELQHNPYNFLFIQEPNQLFGYHDWAAQNHKLFSIILTWGENILNTCPNAIFFPFAAGDHDMPESFYSDKAFEVSFMCGPKNMIEGHILRHSIYNNSNKINIPIKFFFKGDKRPCWNSLYHIAVENSRNKGYFTEKIVDAFLSRTIPIYWGCPNIGDFFNMEGILTFNTLEELINIVNNLTPEFYESKKEVMEQNRNIALQYADFVGRIGHAVKVICKENNI